MGAAMEIIAGQVTAAGATLTDVTMFSGNSLTVRAANQGSDVHLLSLNALSQAAGLVQLRSPLMHDNVRGIRLGVVASRPAALLPPGPPQRLFPQDTLTLQLSGSATAGDIEIASLLVFYDDLPGTNATFIDKAALMSRAKNVLTVENTLAAGTTGGWSGEELLNTESDLLQADRDYALVGYQVRETCGAVRWRGSDWGNLGVGGPGDATDKHLTAKWFIMLSDWLGKPAIPVLNASNAGSINVDCAQDENGTDVLLSTILVELTQ